MSFVLHGFVYSCVTFSFSFVPNISISFGGAFFSPVARPRFLIAPALFHDILRVFACFLPQCASIVFLFALRTPSCPFVCFLSLVSHFVSLRLPASPHASPVYSYVSLGFRVPLPTSFLRVFSAPPCIFSCFFSALYASPRFTRFI